MSYLATAYGTHQLQLKCDTRVPRVCRPRYAHALLLRTRVYFRVFLSLTPQIREKTHEIRVHEYTFLYTRARESRCNMHKATSL